MNAKAKPEVDLAKLQTDVALLKQFNAKFVEPSLKRIDAKLDSLQFVSISEFEEHKVDVDKRFEEMKKRNWVQNTVSAMFGAFLTLLLSYFIRDLLNR